MYLCIFFTCACVFLVWPVDVYLALAVSVFLLLPFAELILIASFCAALLLLSERTSLYFHVLWPTSLLLFCFGCCTSVLYAHMLVYSYLSWPCTTCVELFSLTLNLSLHLNWCKYVLHTRPYGMYSDTLCMS